MVSTMSSSTAKSSLHQLQTFNSDGNKSRLRDAIFSPYLNGKHGETSQKHCPFISSNRKDPLHRGEKKEEDGEIGVFGAEKYFNEEEVEASSGSASTKYLHHDQSDHQIALQTGQYKVQYGTPSIRSESTCNSQSVLLHSASMMRDSTRNKQNKAQTKGFLAGLGFKCSCSDKNSVDTCDHAGKIYDVFHGKTTPKKAFSVGLDANSSVKTDRPHAEVLLTNKDAHFPTNQEKFGVGILNKENGLAFSRVNSGLGNRLVQMQLQAEEEEEPRKSLAVYGSSPRLNTKKSLSFDRKLIIPSWGGADPKVEEVIDFSENSGSNYNDAASDASSDLFEIESIKGKSDNSFLARQASDAASGGCASPTNYAPSEASIAWSVVTASAAVLSDSEEQMSEVTIRSPIRTPYTPSSNGKSKGNKATQRRHHGMLLGCKSHKAVRVAGDAFITYEKPSSSPQIRQRTSISQVPRFPTESKLGNFGARHGQHAYATPHQHASELLYK